MPEVCLNALDSRYRNHIDKAEKALDKGNPGYAIDVYSALLKKHPECLEVRKVLRRAQHKNPANNQRISTKIKSKLISVIYRFRGWFLLNYPKKKIILAERILSSNPNDTFAHQYLARSALALGLNETAIFAYESVRSLKPENKRILLNLAKTYFLAKRNREAIQICDSILSKNPSGSEAQLLIKQASVALSIEQGQWEEDSNFHSKLHNKTESQNLELTGHLIKDESELKKLIAITRVKIEREPDNINNYRTISQYYQQLGEYDEAIHWIRQVRKTNHGASDAALEHLEIDLEVGKEEHFISSIKQRLSEYPSDNSLKQQLKEAQETSTELNFRRIELLVEKYPNDNRYHFEYGELLYGECRLRAAAEQFQLTQRDPKFRLLSYAYLGRIFKREKKYDLAVNQLYTVKNNTPVMDEFKKDVVYELADCYAKLGEKEKAIAEYKQIYACDIAFRDVTVIVNNHYQKSAPPSA